MSEAIAEKVVELVVDAIVETKNVTVPVATKIVQGISEAAVNNMAATGMVVVVAACLFAMYKITKSVTMAASAPMKVKVVTVPDQDVSSPDASTTE